MSSEQQGKQAANRSSLLLILAIAVVIIAPVAWSLLTGPVDETTSEPGEVGPAPEVRRVSPADARAAAVGGNALMVDVRQKTGFARAHISGALLIPAADIPARYQELPQDRPIYLYCTCPYERTSASAAAFLIENGYSEVMVVEGGFEAWQDAGYPVETGEAEGGEN